MRQGQNSKRSRGRGSSRRNASPRHQTFDSNGPSVRIRGSAYQVHEKYLALARDAGSAGDRIAAENYLQHAEHYFRIINTDNDGDSQNRGRGQQNGSDGRGGRRRDDADGADAAASDGSANADGGIAAQDAEAGRTNGSDGRTGAGPDESGGEPPAEPGSKRRVGRGNGKSRGARSASKAESPDGGGLSAASNGADANDLDVPTSDE